MRILWKSAHPDMPTAYASQTALIVPRLQALGHDIAISCTAGQISHHSFWRGIPVFGATPYVDTGEDVIQANMRWFEADLLITLMDTWVLHAPELLREHRSILLTPVDCDPMGIRDYGAIVESGAMPAAVSRFGEAVMRRGGPGREKLDPLYLPHGVDLKTFSPPADRGRLRSAIARAWGFDPDAFTVGMNFMNNDKFRKNFQEAIRGFAEFHAGHPDSVLMLHAVKVTRDGVNLPAYVRHLGIEGAVRFSPQDELTSGLVTPADLADWYGALDVLLGIGNEGFGLPAVEAQACGTPVILLDAGTGPELVGDGWLVSGQPWWNDVHQADWTHASIPEVTEALETARADLMSAPGPVRQAARDNAMPHDINKIISDCWGPALDGL